VARKPPNPLVLTGGSAGAGGGGDVVGPVSATDGTVAVFDGVTGKLLKSSKVTSLGVQSAAAVISHEDAGGDLKLRSRNAGVDLASDASIDFYDDPDIASGVVDVTLERSGANTLEVTGGLEVEQLNVDNLRLDGNTLGSTSGDLAVTRAGVTMLDIVDVGGGTIRARFYGGGGIGLEGSAGTNLQVGRSTERLVFGGGNGTDWYVEGSGGASHLVACIQGDVTGVSRGLRTYRPVEASTAGSGAPNVLAVTESRKLITNTGVTAEAYNSLPPSAPLGTECAFYCDDTDGIRVTAPTGETIRLEGSASAAAGFIRSVAIGSGVILTKVAASSWASLQKPAGTWTIDV
jgi:hypothetical protein